jgi:Protein of unknown function (DUF2971)
LQRFRFILSGRKLTYEDFSRDWKKIHGPALKRLKSDCNYRKQKATIGAHKNWDNVVGILSLSAAEKNLLMWAHYADSHRGLVIEFDPKHRFFNQPSTGPKEAGFDVGILTEVIYSSTRPKINLQKTTSLETLPMLKTKSDEWIREQEWRVYQLLEKRDEEVKGNLRVCLFKLPSDCIKGVVVGRNMDNQNRKRVVEAVKRNSKLNTLK